MTINIGLFQFVLTPGDRPVIVVRDTTSTTEICMDMTKEQASTLADAIKALSRSAA
jgi:hypothetical protein